MGKRKKKRAVAVLKLQATGGQATPAPPLGPALSQHRVNIGQFISQFNEKTRNQTGVPLPFVLQIYVDGSFEFEIKSPPAAYLVKRAAEVAKGSGLAGREEAGSVTRSQLTEIAQQKMEDLNARDLEAAIRMIEGTARSCGISVQD
jgi:large subunit ribosomal protein L11